MEDKGGIIKYRRGEVKGELLQWYCFFFQAEDGIRDWSVTGVQTCALPISEGRSLHKALLPDLIAEVL